MGREGGRDDREMYTCSLVIDFIMRYLSCENQWDVMREGLSKVWMKRTKAETMNLVMLVPPLSRSGKIRIREHIECIAFIKHFSNHFK